VPQESLTEARPNREEVCDDPQTKTAMHVAETASQNAAHP
jgi:hypothetical protein